jgi:CRISPR-associated protein Cas1
MVGRIVEIATEGQHLSIDRGFLVASRRGEELARTPIDDIDGLISAAHGLSFSANVLVALAERGSPVVLCGPKFRPDAIVWPMHGHHRAAARLSAQIEASLPLRKGLWRDIVRAKIRSQAAVLESMGRPTAHLGRMTAKVRSGDPSNVEAQAARYYWREVMGKDFRRDPDGDDVNVLLNYGYAVLRASVARHIAAAGLHPNIPVHHANETNPLRLADDLVEPFRPLADACIVALAEKGITALDLPAKRALGTLPTRTLDCGDGRHPLGLMIAGYCSSLAEVFEGKQDRLYLPEWNGEAVSAFAHVHLQ